MSAVVSARTELDRAAADVAAAAGTWAALPIPTKLAMLVRLRRRTWAEAERWVEAACSAKGIDPRSPLAGEEWLSGPHPVLTTASALHQSLERLWRGQTTFDPAWVRTGPEGRAVVRVLPVEWHDRLLLSGYSAEVWMQPGVHPGNLAENTASFYSNPQGGACLVLGAGNIASISPLDVLHALFVTGQTVALKMNPVNDYLGPILEEIFADFITAGYVRLVYGGSDVGSYLVSHEAIDRIHITGSDRTHDAIVFGPGEEGRERKERGQPVLTKPITSELGGISPVIVVPGSWADEDLQYQAEHVVTQKLHNGGFNCIAAQVLVLPSAWDSTAPFVGLIERELSRAPSRPAYYPGAEDRVRRAQERHGGANSFEANGRVHLRDVPAGSASFAFTEELFSAVFATTRLPGDPGAFLDAAVRFANVELHGSLGASILIHPETRAALGTRFDAAVARMRYGTIGINVWSGMGFSLPRASWGAFPGGTIHDVGSGVGAVHNALMFDRPERTVITGPFRPFHRSWRTGELHLAPKPPWFVTHDTAAATARGLTAFAADPSLRHLPRILAAALRG